MKFLVFAASIGFAGLVVAQTATLPLCAQNCTTNAIPATCNLNPACICSTTSFLEAVTCCVAGACSAADQEATLKYAQSICQPAGVTNLPTAAACASSTSSTGDTAAGSGTPSSVASSAASSITSGATTAASSAATSSSRASAASAASSAAAASGAPRAGFVVQGMGVIGAAVAGAVALM